MRFTYEGYWLKYYLLQYACYSLSWSITVYVLRVTYYILRITYYVLRITHYGLHLDWLRLTVFRFKLKLRLSILSYMLVQVDTEAKSDVVSSSKWLDTVTGFWIVDHICSIGTDQVETSYALFTAQSYDHTYDTIVDHMILAQITDSIIVNLIVLTQRSDAHSVYIYTAQKHSALMYYCIDALLCWYITTDTRLFAYKSTFLADCYGLTILCMTNLLRFMSAYKNTKAFKWITYIIFCMTYRLLVWHELSKRDKSTILIKIFCFNFGQHYFIFDNLPVRFLMLHEYTRIDHDMTFLFGITNFSWICYNWLMYQLTGFADDSISIAWSCLRVFSSMFRLMFMHRIAQLIAGCILYITTFCRVYDSNFEHCFVNNLAVKLLRLYMINHILHITSLSWTRSIEIILSYSGTLFLKFRLMLTHKIAEAKLTTCYISSLSSIVYMMVTCRCWYISWTLSVFIYLTKFYYMVCWYYYRIYLVAITISICHI